MITRIATSSMNWLVVVDDRKGSIQMAETFEAMLTGGHPNSLGRTEEVAQLVVDEPERIAELFLTYDSEDEVVRLRVSSAFKRVFLAQPQWFKKWYSRFSKRVIALGQPSALWTFSLLCLRLEDQLTPKNKKNAVELMREVLETCDDWIVINNTLETLGHWAKGDAQLRRWLRPRLLRYSGDRRKSVAKKAQRITRGMAKPQRAGLRVSSPKSAGTEVDHSSQAPVT
jgi:hypothetical protein